MQFTRGFLVLLSATWACALVSFLSPSIVVAIARVLTVERPAAGWLFAPLLVWVALCGAGLVSYRMHARWLLLSAPMAFFTPLVSAVTVFGCLARHTCG